MSRDTNFYYSFLVLPAHKRHAIVAVWDFCRAVDDAVDEAGDRDLRDAERELSRWRAELDACFDGGVPATPQGRALAPLVAAFGLHRADFDALIEGVEMDVRPRRYETFADLYEYCIRVASAVGLICLDIFGAATTAARQYATDLGVALQLTNILRDVPGDLARGRVYIPLEDFGRTAAPRRICRRKSRRAGSGIRSAAVKALLAHQGGRAREYYARAARALPPHGSPLAGRGGDHGRHLSRDPPQHRASGLRRLSRGRADPAPAAGGHRRRRVGADDAGSAAGGAQRATADRRLENVIGAS